MKRIRDSKFNIFKILTASDSDEQKMMIDRRRSMMHQADKGTLRILVKIYQTDIMPVEEEEDNGG